MKQILLCALSSGAAALATVSAHAQPAPSWGSPQPGAFEYLSPSLTPLSGSGAPPTTLSNGPAPAAEPEFDRVADALDNDVDRIYEYVRNRIRTTPQFGLSKGAYGAMLDGAGTPFDQADLMVRLVRAAGGTANYAYGDVLLTGAEFTANFGPGTARHACELLAVGGIPAQINGSSGTSCSSFSASSGSLSSVQMRHAWVTATVSGATYHFDPSLKPHPRAPRADSVFAVAPTGAAIRSAAGGSTGASGATGVNHHKSFNPASVRSTLSGSVSAVRDAVVAAEARTESTLHAGTINVVEALSIRDVVGGSTIERAHIVASTGAPRNSSHPDQLSAPAVYSQIPTPLRTWVHIRFHVAGQGALVDHTFDAAQIAGRRVMMVPDNAIGIDQFDSVSLSLMVDGDTIETGGYSIAGYGLTGLGVAIGVEVDHPYFGGGSGASQADAEYEFVATNAFPALILLGFGERGNGSELRNTAAVSGSGVVGWQDTTDQTCTGSPCEFPEESQYRKNGKTNAVVAAGEGYLTHASSLLDIYEGAAKGRRVTNHLVGIAGVTIEMVPGTGQLGGQQLFLNLSGSLGYAALDATGRSRDAFAYASGSALAGLELAVLKGQADTPSVNGTASMFEWFQNSSSNLERAYAPVALPDSSLQIRFLQINAANQAAADTLLWNGEYASGPLTVTTPFADYTGAGFSVLSPQSMRIGPVRNAMREVDEWAQNCSFPNCTIEGFDGPLTWRERNRGYLAWSSTSSAVRIAPVANGRQKGGGAGNFPEAIETPTADREALDEAYESWATAFSVDMRTGGLTLTPPADLVTGAGDSPYSLGFQRTYSSERGYAGPLGWGWTHNFDSRLTLGTDIGAALGDQSPHHAIATLLTAQSLLDLFASSTSSTLPRDLIAAQFVQNWWADAVFENSVRIQRGAGTERFVRQPDGVWSPEPGSAATLIQSGSSIARAGVNPAADPPSTWGGGAPLPRTVSEGYIRNAISFTYTSASGVTEAFTYGFDATTGMYPPEHMSANSNNPVVATGSTFLRRSTQFPYGMTITYGYTTATGGGEYLTSVSNNSPFNRSLTLTYETNPHGLADISPEAPVPDDGDRGAQFRLVGVRGDQNRIATFSYDGTGSVTASHTGTLTGVTDVSGAVTTYRYIDLPVPGTLPVGVLAHRVRLAELYLPHAPSTAFFTFGYDPEARTTTVRNARPATWSYFAAGGARGLTRDPNGWESFAYYNENGWKTGGLNARAIYTHLVHDGAGRPVAEDVSHRNHAYTGVYTRRAYAYDENGNRVLERQLARINNSTGAPLSSTVLEAVREFTYPNFPSLVTREIDPNGEAVRYCYNASQSGCSAVQSAGHDGLLRGAYGAEGEETLTDYDGYGRVTRVRAREN